MKSRMMMVWALSGLLASSPLPAGLGSVSPQDSGQADWFGRNAAAVMAEKAAAHDKMELANGRSIDKKIADRLEKSRRVREAKKLRREQERRARQAQQAQKERQASEPK